MTEAPSHQKRNLWAEAKALQEKSAIKWAQAAALKKEAAEKWTEAGEMLEEAAEHHREYMNAGYDFKKSGGAFLETGLAIIKKAEGE